MWKDVSLRLILKDKGGIYPAYHFVDSNKIRVKVSSKKGSNRKMMHWNKGLRSLCTFVLEFKGNFMQSMSAFFIVFYGDKKRILASLAMTSNRGKGSQQSYCQYVYRRGELCKFFYLREGKWLTLGKEGLVWGTERRGKL